MGALPLEPARRAGRGARRVVRPIRRLGGVLGPDGPAARQSLIALGLSVTGAVVAGLTLGSIRSTLESFGGLLVLVPALVAGRGAVFGGLGARLGTAIHTGQFVLSRRTDTVVGQNLVAAAVLSAVTALVTALLAAGLAGAFDVADTMAVDDFVVISVGASLLASSMMAAATVALVAGSVRWEWDPDNVTAPLVTAMSDMVTLPMIWVASNLAGRLVTPALALVFALGAVGSLAWLSRARLAVARRIVEESVPVLAIAGLVSLVAGVVIEKRLERFAELPAMLVLVPPFLAGGGALGGILASRLGSKLHLGAVASAAVPDAEARRDLRLIAVLAVPVFVAVASATHLASSAFGMAGPEFGDLLGLTMAAAVAATAAAMAAAYYGAIASQRAGLDPDTTGIPMVASAMDLAGAFALITAAAAFGVI